MNCLNSLLCHDRAAAGVMAGAGIKAHDSTRIGVRIPLVLIEETQASSSLPVGRGFQQRLLQTQSPDIELDKELKTVTKSLLFFLQMG